MSLFGGNLTMVAASSTRYLSSEVISLLAALIAITPREFIPMTWLLLTLTVARGTCTPETLSASVIACTTASTTSSIRTTEPLRIPVFGELP